MSLPIFTIQTFNQNLLQSAGAVFAQRVEFIKTQKNTGFLGTSTNDSGDRRLTVETKINELHSVLIKELNLQTIKKFPNAVALVDVTIHFSDIGSSDSGIFLIGQASATALLKREKTINTSRVVSSSGPVASAPVVSGPVAPTGIPAPPLPVASGPPNQKPMNAYIPPVGGKRKQLNSRKIRK